MQVAVAVDTCVLLDRAADHEPTIDAINLIFTRLGVRQIGVPPTVVAELNAIYEKGDPAESQLAETALRGMLEWGFAPFDLVPVGFGIVEQIALALALDGLLPDEEKNDAFIIAECALVGFSILVSSDGHMNDVQESGKLHGLLERFDVEGSQLLIASPRGLLKRFVSRSLGMWRADR